MPQAFQTGSDSIPAGVLDRRVTLLSPNALADATGFVPVEAMTPVRTIWAHIEARGLRPGDEMLAADRDISERWVIITCRWPASKDVVEGWWIQHAVDSFTESYDVRAIDKVVMGGEMIQFHCRMIQ
jgi:head-tail adaptor